jgi:hypothetical protein
LRFIAHARIRERVTGQKKCLGLLCHRPCLVPTWRGWLALLLVLTAVSVFVVRGAYGFLAVNDPLPGGLLVIEGWAPDYTLAEALPELKRRPYEGVFVTGGPIENGRPLLKYRTYAELGAAILEGMGMAREAIHVIPAPAAIRDRTFASAIALKEWLRASGIASKRINILGTGPHSRRTRLVYQKAFGDEVQIGVVATPEINFDPERWWASSQGFRVVINEMIGYGYARFLFSPRNEAKAPPAFAEKQ